MKILQYNIQSLKANRDNLDFYVNNNDFDFCVLCETFSLGDGSLPNLCNFRYVEKPRSDGYGGVAIFYKNNIKLKILNFKSNYDVLIIETTNLSKNIIICATYFPQNILIGQFNDEINRILDFLNEKHNFFLLEDFNARHMTYGDYISSNRGKNLVKNINKSNFVCLNDGACTFKENFLLSKGSVLDLSFAIHSFPIKCEVADAPLGGSHHFPIIIKSEEIKQNEELFCVRKNLSLPWGS